MCKRIRISKISVSIIDTKVSGYCTMMNVISLCVGGKDEPVQLAMNKGVFIFFFCDFFAVHEEIATSVHTHT